MVSHTPIVPKETDINIVKGEHISEMGPIEPSVPVDQVSKTPPPLPKEFEWCEIDMTNDAEVKTHTCYAVYLYLQVLKVKELYELLTYNYVEDDDAQFRFDYSAKFFKW